MVNAHRLGRLRSSRAVTVVGTCTRGFGRLVRMERNPHGVLTAADTERDCAGDLRHGGDHNHSRGFAAKEEASRRSIRLDSQEAHLANLGQGLAKTSRVEDST